MVSQSCRHYDHWIFILIYILSTELVVTTCQESCPLWHTYSKYKDSCECCSSIEGVIKCEKGRVLICRSYCLTWNNTTRDLEISRCLQIPHERNMCNNYNRYSISSDIAGPTLNNVTCKPYNRQGAQCQHCIDGYGPAAFSDGTTCADCSKHRYMWILNLIFQLMAVTLMYLIVILFQIKGTCSPFNIIITNCQLILNAILIGSGLRARLICTTDQRFTRFVLTLFGVFNLDFFRFIIPPLCISPSMKSVHILLFDYILAVYPIIVTAVIYVAIELHDRNCRIIVVLSAPLKLIWCQNWRPKETILNTCATFLLLTYSKFLSVSISLLIQIRIHNCKGEVIPNSSVLLYDPSVNFLHSEHIPYVILALSIVIIFVLLPPLLLLLYPTRLFRKCLTCCGFRRWDILHLVMDVFQGWYKDGTEGTYDYRSLSALYMILRIVFSFTYFKLLVSRKYHLFKVLVGLVYTFLGVMFLAFKPYKMNWMNHTDGNIFLLLVFLILTNGFMNKVIYYIEIASGLSAALVIILCLGYKCVQKIT